MISILGIADYIPAYCQSYDSLDVNNFNARINSTGDQFWDGNYARFEVPKGSGKHAIFTSTFWIGGLDDSNRLYVSGEIYRGQTMAFWNGPVAPSYSTAFDKEFNAVWKISRAEVELHKVSYHLPTYIHPHNILTWPAAYNTSLGGVVLAPFADKNLNGRYEPRLGDYPLIRGDQAVYFIINDDRAISGGLGFEIHGMAYAFDDSMNEDLRNSMFIQYKIFNRSSNNYHDVFIANFVDYDLGCYNDDRAGCDSLLQSFFVYNGDDNDQDCSTSGYGIKPPALGITFVSHPMFAFHNAMKGPFSINMPEPGNLPDNFYLYMQGLWKDGTPMIYDGKVIRYENPGDPKDSLQWSDNWPPFDRKGVGSIGPFDIDAGESFCFSQAIVFQV